MMDKYIDCGMNKCSIEKTSVVRNDYLFYFDIDAKKFYPRFILQLSETSVCKDKANTRHTVSLNIYLMQSDSMFH